MGLDRGWSSYGLTAVAQAALGAACANENPGIMRATELEGTRGNTTRTGATLNTNRISVPSLRPGRIVPLTGRVSELRIVLERQVHCAGGRPRGQRTGSRVTAWVGSWLAQETERLPRLPRPRPAQ